MFPFLCTPILAIHLLAQRPFKESNACSKRPRALVLSGGKRLNLLSGKPGRISKGGLAGHVTIRYNIEHLH